MSRPAVRDRLLHALGQQGRRGAARAFEAASAGDLRAVQLEHLRRVLRANEDTEYGRRHGFADAARGDPMAFVARAPIVEAGDVAPYVKRAMRGERDVLTRERAVAYVSTSGTTSEPKFVAITEGYRREYQEALKVSLHHLYRRHPAGFRGKALYFAGAARLEDAPDGTPIGTMSGFNFARMPRVARALYAWPAELFAVKDYRAREWLSLFFAVAQPVTLIGGIFPSAIVSLLRSFDAHADSMLEAATSGRLPASLELPEPLRTSFQARLAPSRALADRLREARRFAPTERGRILFPHLGLVYCWITSTAGAYVPELKRLLGDVPVRDAVYSACEGWCNVPMGDEAPGGPVAITSHFFEFIEEEAFAAGSRATRLVDELEEGKRYAIVFTTAGGLYRYLLNDRVEVTGRYRGVPRIVFAGKVGNEANLAGEKLVEGHATAAVSDALRARGVDAVWFTLAPSEGAAIPGYRLFVELREGEPAELQGLEAQVDANLASVAVTYGRLRRADQLARLEIVRVSAGTYAKFRARRVAEGASDAQLKVSHLVSDPRKLSAILGSDERIVGRTNAPGGAA